MIDINAHNEFGFILWYYAPIAYDLYLKNELGTTSSKLGSKPVFYFSSNHKEVTYNSPLFEKRAQCYQYKIPEFTQNNWTPPPYNTIYKNDLIKFDKPILTINNKNTMEWSNSGIFNYFNAQSLDQIIRTFRKKYQIIYIRPSGNSTKIEYEGDRGQSVVDIGDIEVLKKYPDVLWIDDMFDMYPMKTYNELQFSILANSDMHIASAGDATIPAYFGGDLLIYTHTKCPATKRGVWKTDSWLKILSGTKIYGFTSHKDLLNKAIELW